MKSFFKKLFERGTFENRLFLASLTILVFLTIIDDLFDQYIWQSDLNWVLISSLKFLVSIPISWLVIFLLGRFFNKELTKTRIALETSEKRFRTIFENNASSIMIIERDSTITMVNNAYCEITGFSREEIVGSSWMNLVPDSELERLKEYNRLRFSGASDIPNIYEFKFIKKNGEIRVGLMSVFFDEFLNQIVISITDITDRKAIEVSLEESKKRYQSLVEMQGEGLGNVDKEERFIFANAAAERIMGVPPGTLVGRKLDEFVSQPTLKQIQKETYIRKEGSQSTYEMEIIRPDGEKRVLLVTATPNFNPSGEFEYSLGIFLDITDRKNIENELKKNETELKALNTTKDKLFSIIAHDLRGPVGTSADLLEVMMENYTSLSDEEQLKMLEILKNSAKSTFNLLETLLNWTIIQTGNLVFKPEFFSLTGCIESIVENLSPSAFSKSILLSFNPEQELFVYADRNMMQTILRNLIGNAIKYTSRGGSIVVNAINKNNNPEISIADNGVGMDEETRKNLFVLNRQNSKYGTENEKGTGLGLILCKEFIEKHRGRLIVESEFGKGSTFTFDIPKIFNQPDVQDKKPIELNPESKKFNNELILIVEDEEINYHIIRSILTSVNLQYERASNGKKAVDMFLHNKYSLILMDIQLSEMNGWEATMKIRENDSEIPIIAVTAYASDPTRRKSLEAGCNDFITKPINKTKLIQLIEKYLNKSRISLITNS
ncbi:MAG: PAS domain S-box protein [Prolixibacteraceae bacterium]